MKLAAALLLLQTVNVNVEVDASAGRADTLPRFHPDSAALATAYADAATRELVQRARRQRGVIDASVFAYRATVRQRISVSLSALRRDRLLYRRETAARIDWRRDGTSRVEVVGAREAVPIAVPGLRVPDDLSEFALELVPEPGDDRLFVAPDDEGFAWHPLIEGGEAVYRYASGDTTRIQLPDGRRIRLVELRVTPRERDIRLVAGSFWIELEDYAIVQAIFRPSREFDLERDMAEIDPSEADDVDEVPGILKPIQFDLRYVAVDYGLWEMRWWMPRLVAVEGSMRMGPARFPISFAMTYSDYQVEPDRYGLPSLPPLVRGLVGDPLTKPRIRRDHPIVVTVADSADLLVSPLLPASPYEPGEALLSDTEIRDLAARVGALPARPWEAQPPRVSWPWDLGSGLLRYNRVEGLSAGLRVDWDLTRAQLDLTTRLGFASLDPAAELGIALPRLRRTWRLAGYHRLASVDPSLRPFGLGNSLSAVLFGRDEGQYFRATGLELGVQPAPGAARYRLRLYAERQREVRRESDFSVRRLLDGDHDFRANIPADRAEQGGLEARIGTEHGLDPDGLRWGAWLDVRAETGTFDFARPGLTAQLGGPLLAGLVGSIEAAGGTTLGAGDSPAPIQSLWYLGGPSTLRGFPGGFAAGPDYMRGRVEIGRGIPAVRLVAFSDVGWVGRFEYADSDDALVSAGIGASFLDGLLRIDLARAIQPDRGWRVDSYLDALF